MHTNTRDTQVSDSLNRVNTTVIIITTNPVPDSWRKSIKSQWLVYDDVKYW